MEHQRPSAVFSRFARDARWAVRLSPLALAAWLLGAFPAPAQEKNQEYVPPRGSHAFRNILDHFQYQPVKKLEELAHLRPAETAIIVFGDNTILDDIRRLTGGLEEFKNQGGAVLVATDRDTADRLGEWQLRIDGEAVFDHPRNAYKFLPDCPFLVQELDRDHPLFRGLARGLATNRPSYIQVRRRFLPILAGFPETCWVESKPRLSKPPFAVGTVAAHDADRVLILAGHSVFMNVLMGQPDNDNFSFARNSIRWLSETRPGKTRKHVLFVEEGRIMTRLAVPLAIPRPPPLPPERVLNHLLRGLEQENFFNRFLRQMFTREQILRSCLFLATGLLLAAGCRRLFRSRYRAEYGVPLVALGPAIPVLGVVAVAQRQKALVKMDNFWEPARALARFFFQEWTKPFPPDSPQGPPGERRTEFIPFSSHAFPPDSPQGPPGEPRVFGQLSWWRRRALQRQVQYLWNLAHGPPQAISHRKFVRLPAMLDGLAAGIGAEKFEREWARLGGAMLDGLAAGIGAGQVRVERPGTTAP